jgi:hypothetical protein
VGGEVKSLHTQQVLVIALYTHTQNWSWHIQKSIKYLAGWLKILLKFEIWVNGGMKLMQEFKPTSLQPHKQLDNKLIINHNVSH